MNSRLALLLALSTTFYLVACSEEDPAPELSKISSIAEGGMAFAAVVDSRSSGKAIGESMSSLDMPDIPGFNSFVQRMQQSMPLMQSKARAAFIGQVELLQVSDRVLAPAMRKARSFAASESRLYDCDVGSVKYTVDYASVGYMKGISVTFDNCQMGSTVTNGKFGWSLDIPQSTSTSTNDLPDTKIKFYFGGGATSDNKGAIFTIKDYSDNTLTTLQQTAMYKYSLVIKMNELDAWSIVNNGQIVSINHVSQVARSTEYDDFSVSFGGSLADLYYEIDSEIYWKINGTISTYKEDATTSESPDETTEVAFTDFKESIAYLYSGMTGGDYQITREMNGIIAISHTPTECGDGVFSLKTEAPIRYLVSYSEPDHYTGGTLVINGDAKIQYGYDGSSDTYVMTVGGQTTTYTDATLDSVCLLP